MPTPTCVPNQPTAHDMVAALTPRLTTFARRLAAKTPGTTADDLLQDAALAILKHAHRGGAHCTALARYAMLDACEHARQQERLPLAPDANIPAPDGAEDDAGEQDVNELISDLTADYSERDRSIVLAAFGSPRYPVREIGRLCKVRMSAVLPVLTAFRARLAERNGLDVRESPAA